MKLPKELQKYHEPLESLQRLMSQFNHRGVVIDGIAVSILGEARYKEDLDAMFLLSTQEVTKFLDAAKQEGIEPRIENAADFARKARASFTTYGYKYKYRYFPGDPSIRTGSCRTKFNA